MTPGDDRAKLANLIAEYLMRNRTVPCAVVEVQVTPDEQDAAPTVVLVITTKAGQRITAGLQDNPENDA